MKDFAKNTKKQKWHTITQFLLCSFQVGNSGGPLINLVCFYAENLNFKELVTPLFDFFSIVTQIMLTPFQNFKIILFN